MLVCNCWAQWWLEEGTASYLTNDVIQFNKEAVFWFFYEKSLKKYCQVRSPLLISFWENCYFQRSKLFCMESVHFYSSDIRFSAVLVMDSWWYKIDRGGQWLYYYKPIINRLCELSGLLCCHCRPRGCGASWQKLAWLLELKNPRSRVGFIFMNHDCSLAENSHQIFSGFRICSLLHL